MFSANFFFHGPSTTWSAIVLSAIEPGIPDRVRMFADATRAPDGVCAKPEPVVEVIRQGPYRLLVGSSI
jgi:hypothetical protein